MENNCKFLAVLAIETRTKQDQSAERGAAILGWISLNKPQRTDIGIESTHAYPNPGSRCDLSGLCDVTLDEMLTSLNDTVIGPPARVLETTRARVTHPEVSHFIRKLESLLSGAHLLLKSAELVAGAHRMYGCGREESNKVRV